jgi:2-polyprenyl-3-methyl-5-hydroxy-6-metoxy-1,4-benzoquinol methylase
MGANVFDLVGRGSLNVWNKYFSNGAHAWEAMYKRGYAEKLDSLDQRPRHYIIAGMIADRMPGTPAILDVGCGCGTLYQFLRRSESTYWGVDLSRVAIKDCENRFRNEPRAHFECIDFLALETDRRFDFVVLNEVLYYFPLNAVPSVLAQASRLLRPYGTVIVSMSDNPKAKSVWRRLAALTEPTQGISMGTGMWGSRWTIKGFPAIVPARPLELGQVLQPRVGQLG